MRRLLRMAHHLLRRLLLCYPKNVVCNVCGWSGRHFLSNEWHSHIICPRCSSAVRHRLLMAALQHVEGVQSEILFDGKRVLHFAPEKYLRKHILPRASEYVTADFLVAADRQLDISNMQEIETGSYDAVIAIDVLEHVPNDQRAIEEIYRVLAPGGIAILSVPQPDGSKVTDEDPTITSPEGRKEAFGQEDHVRLYGNDFIDRLEAGNLQVTTISERDFPDELVKKHVLFPPVLSEHPLVTNHRRLYFAKKAGE